MPVQREDRDHLVKMIPKHLRSLRRVLVNNRLIAYDLNGQKLIKRSDGNGWIDGHDIVTDSEGKIYMLGRTQNYDNSQFFIKKYNTNGEEVWTIEKDILTQGEMRIAENNGNIYVTGYASEYNNNSNQNSKIYILSLTVEGEFVWENYFDITPNYSSRLSFRVNENRIFISFFDQKSQYIHSILRWYIASTE